MSQCPVCKKNYPKDQADILEQNSTAHLVHITCPSCRHAILAVVVVTQLGMSSVGMLTDLSVADVKRLRQQSDITENEVLDFHTALSNNLLINKLI